jgi:tetratricopeptide (TPR) repeat protein
VRTAYSGRAAAYAQKGDFDRALHDYNMAVLLYAVEVDILTGMETPGRDKFLGEAARAYRVRGDFLKARGQAEKAQADYRRADSLDAEAKALASAAKKGNLGQVRIINGWTEPATVRIDGVNYRLEPGEQKVLVRKAGRFTYEVPLVNKKGTRKLEAGQKCIIRIGI